MKKSIHDYYLKRINNTTEIGFDECFQGGLIVKHEHTAGFKITSWAAVLLIAVLLTGLINWNNKASNQETINPAAEQEPVDRDADGDPHTTTRFSVLYEQTMLEIVDEFRAENFTRVRELADVLMRSYRLGELNKWEEFTLWTLDAQVELATGNYEDSLEYYQMALSVEGLPEEARDDTREQMEQVNRIIQRQ